MNKDINLMEEYKTKIKYAVEQNINSGKINEAKQLISEYEKIVKGDIEVCSIKAVIYIMENDLYSAEEILKEGFAINSKSYDLLYNMSYVHQLKNNKFLAEYFMNEANNALNKDKYNEYLSAEFRVKKSKYDTEKAKVGSAPRVLIGSTIRQKVDILKEFFKSLSELYIQDYNIDFIFFDDNKIEESSRLIEEFNIDSCKKVIIKGEKSGNYICDDKSHQWKDELIWKIARYKDKIIDFAKKNNYDYLFLIDSDLVLHPETLERLISTGKDIISEIFWTIWNINDIGKPQVWVSRNYNLYYESQSENLSEKEKKSRINGFIKAMRIPGVYEVGGLGACTLISKKALNSGVCYKKVEGIAYRGEDRHFCARALRLGLKLYVETSIPAYHIYRETELAGVEEYKYNNKKSMIYSYNNFSRTSVKSQNNTVTLAMLVKNEAHRYLEGVLTKASKYVDKVVILDDGSTDNTVEVCKRILKNVPHNIVSNKTSNFNNEIVLRKQLWNLALESKSDWILCLDADEIFEDKINIEIRNLINQPYYDYFDFRLYDFWDKEHFREDKYWSAHKHYRSFLIRYQPNFKYIWNETPVHCGRFPLNIYNLPGSISDLRIKHLGWANEKERIEKYKRYMEHDKDFRYGIREQYESILDKSPSLIKWEE